MPRRWYCLPAGIALRVPKNAKIADPLKLDFTGSGHVRGLLILEEGASLTLVEGAGIADFRNVGFEIVLGENASLEHVRVSPVDDTAVLVEEAFVHISRNGRYRAHFAAFGSKLSRMELEITLDGEGAEAHLSGVSVLDGKRHSDVTTNVIHASGNTNSTQLFRHVVGGTARAVYQGKVTVTKGANGSDSNQSAKALLLGDMAEADLKPELEIFADDVKCAHGAAVGDLDAESLFYLRARGIPEAEARGLLLHAFLEDAVAEIANTDQRELVRVELGVGSEGSVMNAPRKDCCFLLTPSKPAWIFEILSRTVYDKPLAYLDSGASAQKPKQVVDAMHVFATTEYANVHRGVHYLSGHRHRPL